MILAVVFLFAVFVGARALLVRFNFTPAIANGVGAAIVVAFVLGSFVRPFGFSHDAAPDAASAPQAAAAPAADTPAPVGDVHDVSKYCAGTRPKMVKLNGRIVGVVDGFEKAGGDPIAAQATIPSNAAYKAFGWGFDPNVVKPALAACLAVDGKVTTGVQSTYGAYRGDVADAAGAPGLGESGFAMTIPKNTLPKGHHTVSVLIESHDGAFAVLQNTWNLVIQ